MTINSDNIEMEQAEYVCVFCGSMASFNLHGKGVCDSCKEDLEDK